ncbi:MAG: hypothetical protein ACXWHZ_03570 [Usitatibacter sp.]
MSRRNTGRRNLPFRVGGGLNVVDPAILLSPGALTYSKNVEVVPANGGYRRVGGYERYDGRPGAPSLATYTRLTFVGGGIRPVQAGDVVTGFTSGATGVVISTVDLTSGSWSNVTAAGEMRLTNTTGTFVSGEALRVGGITAATLAADPIPRSLDDPNFKSNLRAAQAYYRALIQQVPGSGKVLGVAVYNANVYAFRNVADGTSATMWQATSSGWVSKKTGLAPNGRYLFRVHNFAGGSGTKMLYGVSGVHKGFQWDGTTWTDITTGMTVDTPKSIAVFNNQLYFGFPGGSLQNSGAGTPLTWTLRSGASETGIGDEITGLVESLDSTLTVYGASSIHVFYLAGPALKTFTKKLGAQAYAAQAIGTTPIALDAKGAYLLNSTQAFGDFTTAMLSDSIRSLIDARPVNVRASVVSGARGNYRVLFDDKTGLVAAFKGNKFMGWTQVAYAHQFNCLDSGIDATGREVIFGGTDDGYVMQLETGTSFDGAKIESIMRLPFHAYGMNGYKLRFYKVRLELYSDLPILLQIATEFNYGGEGQSESFDAAAPASGGFWDRAVWENFYWDAAVVTVPEVSISGVGENMGLLFRHEDDIDPSFTLQSISVQHEIWGLVR